jgi:hypothetical protein
VPGVNDLTWEGRIMLERLTLAALLGRRRRRPAQVRRRQVGWQWQFVRSDGVMELEPRIVPWLALAANTSAGLVES